MGRGCVLAEAALRGRTKTGGTLCVPPVVCDHVSCVSESISNVKRVAFHTIRPVVSQKKRGFPLGLGRAALCRRLAFVFDKTL